ncbi:hypothetical protein ACGYK5_15820, partial [Sulfitobacter sp. 1A16787]|uniref:hypothetical protein n=2 Tax=unclassified Sulfitobacter TaxID=196795 RepID=UPI00374561AB
DFALEAGNVAGFEFDADAKAAAVAAVNGVTEDQATVDAAKAATDAYVADGTVPGTVGQTFTLTAEADNFVGTADADTFQAVEGTGSAGTLTVFDKLDGGAGEDTLELISNGTVAIPGGVSIKNIETVNITRDSASGSFNASVFGGATQIWQIDDAAVIEGLVDGQTAGFRDTAVQAVDAVTYDDGATTASIALDNVTDGATLNIDGDDVETVNVSGSINATAATLIIDLGDNGAGSADAVTALNLSLEGNTALTVSGSNGAELETVNASGTTGGITYSLPTLKSADAYALESITGGSGNDKLNIGSLNNLSADTFTVSGGAGNDVMDINNTGNGGTAVAVTVIGGAGSDTLKLAALVNITDASEDNFMDSLITFADFNGDEDVLDITGTLGTLSNTQRANIAAEDNLYDALVNAAAQATGTVAFDFGGDAYVYTNDNSAFDAGDGLVKLAGFSVENFDASNLI